MWNWISKLDPNVIISIVVAVGGYLYHRLVPPAAQSAIDHDLDSVRSLLKTFASQYSPSTTATDLRTALKGFAAIQLAKLGYRADKLPGLLQAGIDAAINAAIAWFYTEGPGSNTVTPSSVNLSAIDRVTLLSGLTASPVNP